MAAAAIAPAGCATVPAQSQRLRVSNPVIPGDLPDPSVIRAGDDYWATATSSEWAPHFPLFHSRDLASWEQAGAVFESTPDWAEANFWAPELVEDRGQFFVYYAARKKGGPLCVAVASADRPQGPYTDHGPLVCDPDGSIDGALVRDEDGVPYLVWKQDGNSHGAPTPIWAQRLAEDRIHLAEGSERRQLIANDAPWEGAVVEGGYVMKRDGWFYLFYAGGACCGRECSYGEGVARSRRLLSGWQKHPSNPIVRAGAGWRCPGHGSVVTDASGRSYLMHHAYGVRDTVYVGRQSILHPLAWSADGWPSIDTQPGSGERARAPAAFSDDFKGPALVPGWQWPLGHKPVAQVSGGALALAPAPDRAADPTGAVLARSTTSGDYAAVAAVDVAGLTAGAGAGLSAFGDPE
ncbi:MAG TPA: glycoside hydrolase family 43 protein, partial [Myxococcales bacterium]|nr:glycoside hydrolase family 43 protein [Myxococcales bacterium]